MPCSVAAAGAAVPAFRESARAGMGLAALIPLLLVVAGEAGAYSTGITGYSNDAGFNCTSCHTGSSFTYTSAFSLSNGTSVAPNSTTAMTFSLTKSSGGSAPYAGFNVSASGGSLNASGTGTQWLDPEITHSSPQATNGLGNASWSFEFVAPATWGGTVTLYGCGNPVIYDTLVAGNNQANDGPAACSTRSLTINGTPNAVNDTSIAVAKNVTTTLSPLSNDTSGPSANETGDSIIIRATGLSASSGSVTRINSNTQLSYTPAANYTGSVTINYQIQDSLGLTDSATMTLTVSNTAPTADNDGTYNGTEDTTLTVTAGSGVLVGDADANSDSLTAVVLTNPSKGSLTLNSDGSFSYVPNANTNGADSFTYRAYDGTAYSSAATVSINIAAVNDAPVAVNDGYATDEDVTLTVSSAASGVRANDTDVETATSSLTVTKLTDPANGTLTLNADGTFTYDPDPLYNGIDTFTYRVSDGTANSNTATVSIAVAAVNNAPTAVADSYATNEDTALNVTTVGTLGNGVLANDTDVDSGSLTAALVSGPSNGALTLNSNGTFTYTPTTNYNGSDSFTYRANDGLANSGTTTVSITVNAVNDAPVISLTSAWSNTVFSVTEESTFTTTPTVTDVDDANDGVNLVWSLASGAPTGMAISNASGTVGRISYTPGQNTVGVGLAYVDASITVQVDDGHENSVTTATRGFTLRIYKKDGDGDLIADYNDNCSTTSNPSQADNDNDGTPGSAGGGTTGGDACDSDDDNDGISDLAELANGLDPSDDSDAGGDLDGDGLTNLEEFQACSGGDLPDCTAIGTDSVGPEIVTNGDLTVDATGYYTVVEVSATANDYVNGDPVPVEVSVDDDGPYRPGEHILTWTAQDGTGNVTTVTQTVRVNPLVSLGGVVPADEGNSARLAVVLNGESPVYPVRIDYLVSGTAGTDDHDLGTVGTVEIASGTTGYIELNATADGLSEADETAVVTLDAVAAGGAVLSGSSAGTFLIVDRNLAPVVSLWVEQNSERRLVAYLDGDKVNVQALSADPNGDVLSYDWSRSDPALLIGAETADTVAIDVSVLDADARYDIVVRVSDGALVTERRITLVTVDTAPTLIAVDSDGDGINDDVEGGGDYDGDGLLDYLDAVDSPDSIAVELDTSEAARFRQVQVDAGLRISAGSVAVAGQHGGVRVLASEVVDGSGDPVVDEDYVILGATYDFVIDGLGEGNRVARVVLPLPLPKVLPTGAVWRKYINGDWFTFVESATDGVASADSDDNGQCPAPSSTIWVPGLNAGDDCVRLTISDGGPNDADGEVNGSIRDPGGAAVPRDPGLPTAPEAESGGGPAGPLFIVLLVLAGFRTRRHGK